jgi:Tol biopolymer transport system component
VGVKAKSELETKMAQLKVNGIPLFVATSKDRLNAHNAASRIRDTIKGYEIETRRRIGMPGYEIHRVK